MTKLLPVELAEFTRALVQSASARVWRVLVLMICVSLTEGVGLLLLIPLLGLTGLAVDDGKMGHVAEYIAQVFSYVGVRPTLLVVLAIYMGVVGARTLLQWWETVASAQLDQEFALSLRQRLYRAITHAKWIFFSRHRASEFTHALTTELDRVSVASSQLLRLLTHILVGTIYVVLALLLAPGITLITTLCGAALLLVQQRWTARARAAGNQLSDASRAVFSAVGEHLGATKTAKSYGAEDRNVLIFNGLSRHLAQTWIHSSQTYAAASAGFTAGSMLILSVVVYVAVGLLRLPPAAILLLLFLFARLVPRFSAIQQTYQQFVNAAPAFSGVMKLIRRCEAEAEPELEASADADVGMLSEGISVRDVDFRYRRDSEAAALGGLDLWIPARQTTAIVGPSGAGKSTLADLLIGLVAPDRGTISVDGELLTPDRVRGWRGRIGYVAQETFLFHDSVRSNLLWAAPHATEAELWDALRLSAADGFVAQLPQGLDTTVGDRGVLLSGGERQRLALARALLRKPSLLILDEATSALDSENERRIQWAIEELHGQMTILIITHRLSTIRGSDIIHVLDAGRLVETGSWQDLVTRETGRFRALYEAQSIGITKSRGGVAANT